MATTDVDVSKTPRVTGKWTSLIDEIVADTWFNPELGKVVSVDYERVVFERSLDGLEAELVQSLDLGTTFAVVCDAATYAALGERVAKNIRSLGPVEPVVLDHPHADLATVEVLKDKIAPYEGVVAVGSGTINDLCKYATKEQGRGYCVFGTAASMNGYTSSTASMNFASGLKVSLPAQAPKGFFVDLEVSAAAPPYLAAAGFADCMARSVAQVDWWMSHQLLGTAYWSSPYLIQEEDERILNARAALLPEGDLEAIASLYRVLTLCGLGISFTGVSNHGSMGEHQISHYIDCFAGDLHPGTLHGQQVGVASLTMARLQNAFLSSETPPQVSPTVIDEADMVRRMGPDIAKQCAEEWRKKAFTSETAAAFNRKMEDLWPTLRSELQGFTIPVDDMQAMLVAAGAPTTADDLGLDRAFYREAVRHNHEMRNRFSFVDIAAGSGMLEAFAEKET
ncbi:MAG: iron-containing alcohol dehydrogenase [Devosiaceae bacterium]|nr:iron-containing alcohol dehydrogenase [Devosiaceae bacterium MH13]